MPYQTTFRPAPLLYAILAVGELISTIAAVVLYMQEGATWRAVAPAATALFFTVGFVDLAVSRIDLEKDQLRITELHRRKVVPKRDIVSAKVDGGAVFLQLQDGTWFKVPSTGRNSLSMVNSVRAWINDRTQ